LTEWRKDRCISIYNISIKDLEFEISERYEDLMGQYSLERASEDCIVKKFCVSNIKHLGYLLVFPRNMPICHFLDDMAHITCDVTEAKKIELKLEEVKKTCKEQLFFN
jgi:hypothetical protein